MKDLYWIQKVGSSALSVLLLQPVFVNKVGEKCSL
jgi:hypothetical protein